MPSPRLSARLLYGLICYHLCGSLTTMTIEVTGTTEIGICLDNEFQCANGQCIMDWWVCDEDDDCADNSDEQDCPDYSACATNEFQCTSGLCILSEWRCDQDRDCDDGSDEVECSGCSSELFQCTDGYSCIPITWRCDGASDCYDSTDETDCEVESPESSFTCSDGEEIDIQLRCDAIRHCSHGDDEEGCQECAGMLCSSSRCIQSSQYCDGVRDCANDEDEPPSCNPSCMVNNGGCEQICLEREDSVLCDCFDGYDAFNRTHCQDHNECDDDDICPGNPMLCVNVPGTFRCLCPPGFIFEPTKETCYSNDSFSPPIIFSSWEEVIYLTRVDLNMTISLTGDRSFQDIMAVDFDPEEGTIVFSENGRHRILKQSLASQDEPFVVANEGVDIVDGMAYDWIYKNLYLTEMNKNKIEVICMKTFMRRVLFNTNLDQPGGIVVDPMRGYLYFTDWGRKPKIEKAAMDGSSRKEIITDNLHWPNGLCIEYTLMRLYWVNAVPMYEGSYIASSDLDGGRIKILLEGSARVQQPFAITVLQDKIYWTDWGMESILTANSFTGDDWTVVLRNLPSPRDIRVFNRKAKYNAENYCPTDKSACSHMCLAAPGPQNYACGCPGNYTLDNDRRTCLCNDTTILGRNGVTCGSDDVVSPTPELEHESLPEEEEAVISKFELRMTCNLYSRRLNCNSEELEVIPDNTPISITCKFFKTTGELMCAF